MNHVLTLVAEPEGLAQRWLDDVILSLESAGAALGPVCWLVPGTAVDLPFGGLDARAAEAAARGTLGVAPVDLLAQPIDGRAKKLLVADLESTIIENEMLDEMAVLVGVGAEVAKITARAMRGEIEFESALEERLQLFTGRPASLLDQVAASIRLSPGAEALIAGLRAAGVTTALVTGGFDVFAAPIARRLGIDRVFANRLAIDGGQLSGRAVPPILGPGTKRETLLALCSELGIQPTETIAVGDGANDLAMLAEAGLGVAYRAKPAVRKAARARIDHTSLDSILFFAGLRAVV